MRFYEVFNLSFIHSSSVASTAVITPAVLATEEASKEPVPVEKMDPRLTESTTGSVEERYQGLKKIERSGEQVATTSKEEKPDETTRVSEKIDSTTAETTESVPKQSREQTSDSKKEGKKEREVSTESTLDQSETKESNEPVTGIGNTDLTPETKAEAQPLSDTSEIPDPDSQFRDRMTTQSYVEKQFNAFWPGGTYKPMVFDRISPNVELVNGTLYIPTRVKTYGNGWQPMIISSNFFPSFQKLPQEVKNKIEYIKIVRIDDTSLGFYRPFTSSNNIFIDTMIGVFKDFKNLKKVDLRYLRNRDVNNILVSPFRNLEEMFAGCSSLTRVWLDDNNDLFGYIESLDSMFEGCTSLTSTDNLTGGLFNFNDRPVTANSMFKGCTSLTKFDLPKVFQNMTSANSFFANCLSLENLNLPFTNTLTSMNTMFENTPKITKIDMTSLTLDSKSTNNIFGTPDTNKNAVGKPLPVVVINKPITERIASTIRHNRARRTHSVDHMIEIVQKLVEAGLSDQWIMTNLGMDRDEILRLKQISGLASLFVNESFSEAWEEI